MTFSRRAEVDLRLYVELEEGRMLPTYDELQRIRAQLGTSKLRSSTPSAS
jgi:hypothetical protein